MKIAFYVVFSRRKEVGKHLIFVGRAQQSSYRQAHLLCVPTCQNIPEVARRHDEINLLAHIRLPARNQVYVRGEVVGNLRRKPPEIDRVRTGNAHPFFLQLGVKILIGKQFLYGALTIVEIAGHRRNEHIVAFLGTHLQALHFRNPFVGIEHRYLRARHVAESFQRRLTRIAAGRGEN